MVKYILVYIVFPKVPLANDGDKYKKKTTEYTMGKTTDYSPSRKFTTVWNERCTIIQVANIWKLMHDSADQLERDDHFFLTVPSLNIQT